MCGKQIYWVLIVLVLGLAVNVATADIESGLVGYWPLDGDATDASGTGLHGTINGNVIPTTDRFGYPDSAMLFPGASNSYIELGDPAELRITGAMTLAAWVRIDSYETNGRIIARIGSTRSYSLNVEGEQYGHVGAFQVAASGNDLRIVTTADRIDFGPDEWFHIAGTFEPSVAMKIYINGELDNTLTDNIPATQFIANTVRIGRSGTTWGEFPGSIDEVRAYSRALSASDIRELFKGVLPVKASDPSPRDEVTDVPWDVTLSWSPGDFANTHDVYFGTSFDAVNDATKASPEYKTTTPLGDESYAPELLDFEMTYYWRIDEVNAAPDFTVFKGDTWQFTTEPFAYPIANVTATASSVHNEGMGPENTINGSGLDENDLHSTQDDAMWLSSGVGPQPTWIQYEFDRAYKLYEMWVWNFNQSFEPSVGFGLKEVTIEYSANGVNWTELDGVPEFAQGPGMDGYAHNTVVSFDGAVAKYVKITANSNWGGLAQYGLSEVRFFYVPVWAREPHPQDGATGLDPDVVLSWRPGREAASHELYLSNKRKAVANGAIAPITVTEASYDAGTLELGKTYYWKINEVNEAETPTTWQGDVWHFAVTDYLLVDDMESYGDANTPGEPGSRIWYTWRDGAGWSNPAPGWGGNGTGAMVDVGTAVVNTGNQSLKYDYDNDGTLGGSPAAYYSEATAHIDDLTTIGRDWTKGGVKALSLWFYGDPGNAATATEQMYVKVGGAKVVYDGAMADIQEASWHEWNIDLADFAALGANLNNVTQISIGFGNENNTTAGRSGVVYFDDIRLYPARCVPERKAPPAADLTGDCVVDYLDIDLMAADWLLEGPDDSDLVAHWKFDEGTGITAQDSSGNGHDGTISGATWTSPGWDGTGWCLYFRGVVGDRVSVGTFDVTGSGITVACWFKADNLDTPGNDPRVVSKAIGGNNEDHWFMVSSSRVGSEKRLRFRLKTDGETAELKAGSAGTIELNEWIHVAATWDGSTMRIYKNGVEVGSLAKGGTLSTDPSVKVAIGNQPEGADDRPFEGLIDDVRIYNYGLSDAEVLYLTGLLVDLHQDGKIDFKDFAVLADAWLDELLWP